MSKGKGFTLIELVLTVIVLSILGAFTFAVIWQYSNIYAATRGGYIYGEAAAVLERMTRELRDAALVDTPGTSYINFELAHGTPTDRAAPLNLSPPYWVQYCTCSSGGRTLLYRVANTSQGAGNQCQSACPAAGSNVSLMSRNITSSGFQITCYPGNGTCGNPGPISDSYEIKLQLRSDQTASSQSVTLGSRVTPRDNVPYNPGSTFPSLPASGVGSDRDFSGNYYDEIN